MLDTHGHVHGHQLGVATTANGDEYAGEWKEGRMDGIGRLHSCNGDLYEGHFRDSKYHGLGTFFKYGSDVMTSIWVIRTAHNTP